MREQDIAQERGQVWRGAIDGLMAEVLEDHIRFHVVDPNAGAESEQVQAAEELIAGAELSQVTQATGGARGH